MDGTWATRTVRCVIGAATVAIVSGCLDIGSEDKSVSVLPEFADVRFSGSVGDGPIIGASMNITGNDGRVLSSFESTGDAGYDVTVRTRPQNYPITIIAEGGIDLVTNNVPDFVLEGVVVKAAKRKTTNINPFSTVAYELAKDLSGGVNSENIAHAEGIVSTQLNFGLSTLVDTGPTSTKIDDSNIAEIVRASEAVGELIRRTRDALVLSGVDATGDDILRAIASDLVDGAIDGEGGSRANSRIAATASVAASQIALEVMQNELHVNGADGTLLMRNAIQQVSDGTPQQLSELTTTVQLLFQARIGLAAAVASTNDPVLISLLDATQSLQPGMAPSVVASLLPGNYRETVGNALSAVANGDSALINDVNAFVRVGDPDPGINQTPTINGSPAATVQANNPYSFLPTAFDPDGDLLTFIASGLPAWATISPNTGVISGTPAETDVGDFTGISVTVSDGLASATLGPFSISVTPPPVVNTPPFIDGTPISVVVAGTEYSFTPMASDPDGDTLVFSVENLPMWADFDTATGRIYGTPTLADVAVYNGVQVTASDGSDAVTLGPFTITVTAIGQGTVTLNWAAPTQNEDNTPLVDLAGYRIYWGTSPGSYPNSVTVNNPGLTTYVVENLGPGTYEFVATSFNSSGIESEFSNPVSRTVP